MNIDSLVQRSNPLQFVPHNASPMVPLILLLNSITTKYSAYYFISIFFKLISLLILSSNFTINQETRTTTQYLRYITSYSLCKLFGDGLFYIIINLILIVLEIVYFSYIIRYIIKFKKRGEKYIHKKCKVNGFFVFLYHFNNLFISQLIEYFILISLALFFKDRFTIFQLPFHKIFHYCLCGINIIVIIFLNFNCIITYLAMNFPFFTKTKFEVKINLTFNRFVIWTIIDNLSIIESFELYLSINLKAYKILVAGLLLVIFFFKLIIDLTHLNFENGLNHFTLLIFCFSFISLVVEVISYLLKFNVISIPTFLFSILCRLFLAFWLIVFLQKIKKKIFLRRVPHILFKIYDDKIHNNDEIFETIYYLFFDLMNMKSSCQTDNSLLNALLNHVENCKNEICKCNLINLIPMNLLSLDKKEFCNSIINRIGFCVETCLIKLDYTSNFYLTVILSEYFYLFKQNSLMSLSIIDTYFNSHHRHRTKTKEYIQLCLLINRYAHKCFENIDYFPMCNLYHALIHDKIISKLMKEYTEIFEKGIIHKENFENGIKCTHDIDTGEVKAIHSQFLSSKNINNIMKLLENQNSLYKKISKTITLYVSNLNAEIPIDFYLKCIFFFYLFNNGHLPVKVLCGDESNRCDSINMFTKYSKQITFFNQATVISDIEDLLNEYYSRRNISYNIILKCVKGFKIEYISGDLPVKLGYSTNDNFTLIGEDFEILFPKDLKEIHHKAMIKYLIANKNFCFCGKKYIFNNHFQLIPTTVYASAMPGIFNKHLEILINLVINNEKNDLAFILNSEYETVTISKSFEDRYAINLEMIRKLDFDLLEIFEIGGNFLKKNFENELKKVDQIKKYIDMSTEVNFCKWLFHNRISEAEIHNLKRYDLFDSLIKGKKTDSEYIESIKEEIENIYSLKKMKYNNSFADFSRSNMSSSVVKNAKYTTSITNFRGKKIFVNKNKASILHNFLRFLTKISELELYDEYVKTLAESIYKFKKQLKYIGEKKVHLKSTKIVPNNSYKIRIKLRILYGCPIFLISIKDKDIVFDMTNTIASHYSIGSPNLSPKFHQLTASKKSMKVKTVQTANSLQHKHSYIKLKNKVHHHSENHHSLFHFFNSQNAHFNEVSNDCCLITGLFTALIISISITSILFYYQNQILKDSHSMFLCLHSNSHQKDALLHLYNNILSILFMAKNIIQSNQNGISLTDYFIKLNETIQHFENYYHEFYMNSQETKMNLNYFSKRFTFTKVHIDWEEKQFEDDYFNQVYSLVFSANQAVKEYEYLDDLDFDIDMVMFEKYKFNSQQEILTRYGKVLFFLKYNYYKVFDLILNFYNTEIVSSFQNYYNSSTMKYVLVEVGGLLTYILFFVQVFVFLHNNNKLIFKFILTMFLTNNSCSNIGKNNLKSHHDNVFLRQKCKSFLTLLKSFQIENLQKFGMIHNRPHTTSIYHDSLYSNINNGNISTNQLSYNNETGLNNSSINNTNNALLTPNKAQLVSASGKDKVIISSLNFNSQQQTHTHHSHGHHSHSSHGSNKAVTHHDGTSTTSQLQSRKTNANTTSTFNTNPNNESTLTISQIIERTYNSGIQVIKLLSAIMLVSFFLILLFFCLKTYFSLSFLSDINLIFDEFTVFTEKYSLLYTYFNTLREILISPYSSDNIETFLSISRKVKENIEQNQNLKLSKFPSTYSLWLSCNENNIDKENLTSNFFENGIDTASNAIILNIENIYSDYLENKDNINSIDDIISLLSLNNNIRTMTLIDLSFNYIYKEVQKLIYSSFKTDAENIRSSFKQKVNIFNIFCLIYCCIIFLIVIYCVVINIKKKVSFVKVASNKFGKTIKHWLHNEIGIYGLGGGEDGEVPPSMFINALQHDTSMSSKK